jgi:hypothetical protein
MSSSIFFSNLDTIDDTVAAADCDKPARNTGIDAMIFKPSLPPATSCSEIDIAPSFPKGDRTSPEVHSEHRLILVQRLRRLLVFHHQR